MLKIKRLSMGLPLFALALTGCGGKVYDSIETYEYSGATTNAAILVSDPQFYRRESLINDRRKEEAYLRKALDESDTKNFTPQLLREVESITALAGQLGLNFDPAAGIKFDQARETGRLEQDIRTTRLQMELESLQRDAALMREQFASRTAPLSTLGNTNSVGALPGGPTPPDASALLTRLDTIAKALQDRLSASVPAPRKTSAEAAPRDEFLDRMAYRDEIRQTINRVALDDLHDFDGNSLFRMQFHATVLPNPAYRRHFGAIHMEVEPPDIDDIEMLRLYLTWLSNITARSNSFAPPDGSPPRPADRRLIDLAALSGSFDFLHLVLPSDSDKCTKTGLYPRAPDNVQAECLQFRIAIPSGDISKMPEVTPVGSPQKQAAGAPATAGAAQAQSGTAQAQAQAQAQAGAGTARADATQAQAGAAQAKVSEQLRFLNLPNLKLAQMLEEQLKQVSKPKRSKSAPQATVTSPEAGPNDIKLMCFARVNEKMDSTYPADQSDPNIMAARIALTKIGALTIRSAIIDAAQYFQDDARWNAKTQQALLQLLVAYEVKFGIGNSAVGDQTRDFLKAVENLKLQLTPDHFSGEKFNRPEKALDCNSYARDIFSSYVPRSVLPPRFVNLMTEVRGPNRLPIRIAPYSVAPNLLAQRVSTVARAADAAQFAMALSASLPGNGLGASAGLSALRQQVGKADALQRVPLVVGYADPAGFADRPNAPDSLEDAGFGWILGPQMTVDTNNKVLALEHPVGPYELTADISMPGWWPYFTLKVRTAWAPYWNAANGDIVDARGTTLKSIRVPMRPNQSDLDRLSAKVLSNSFTRTLEAVKVERASPARISACADDVMIQVVGPNVWRTRDAFLGGMRPSAPVEVLPDMSGVVIPFKLSQLPRRPADQGEIDLDIWTPNGRGTTKIALAGSRLAPESCGTEQFRAGTDYSVSTGKLTTCRANQFFIALEKGEMEKMSFAGKDFYPTGLSNIVTVGTDSGKKLFGLTYSEKWEDPANFNIGKAKSAPLILLIKKTDGAKTSFVPYTIDMEIDRTACDEEKKPATITATAIPAGNFDFCSDAPTLLVQGASGLAKARFSTQKVDSSSVKKEASSDGMTVQFPSTAPSKFADKSAFEAELTLLDAKSKELGKVKLTAGCSKAG